MVIALAGATASAAAPRITHLISPTNPTPPAAICWAPANDNDLTPPDKKSPLWQCEAKGSVELGLTDAWHWFWIRTQVEAENTGIRFMMGLFDNADAIIRHADQSQRLILNQGDSRPFAARGIVAPELIIPLGQPDPSGKPIDIFMRVRTTSAVFFTPEIGAIDTLVRRSMSDSMIAAISSGFLLAVSLYGMVLARGRASYTAVWLSVLALGATLWECSVSGIGFMYLWGDSPSFQTSSTLRGVALWMSGYVLFVYDIMTSSRHARFKWIVRTYAACMFGMAIGVNHLDPTAVGYILSTAAVVLPIPLFILGCISYVKGDKTLRWMLIGVVINDIATALVALSSTGIYPNSATRLLPMVSNPMMIAMFGMTMAARSAAQRKSRLNQLEQTVADRTQSLAQSNDELQVALAQLDAIRNEESRLFRLATHDLRGPLNIISLRLMRLSLEKRSLDHDEIRMELGPLEASVEYLANILEETQTSLSMIGTQEKAKCVSMTNLYHECISIIQAYQPAAAKRGSSLSFTGQPGISMHVDKLRLARILRNWIDNAIEHCPEGSDIQVRLDSTPEKAVISVSDNGHGLASDVEQRIFGEEARLPDGSALHGLGLYSTLANAKRIGAEISYQRNISGGSTFTLSIPVQQASTDK